MVVETGGGLLDLQVDAYLLNTRCGEAARQEVEAVAALQTFLSKLPAKTHKPLASAEDFCAGLGVEQKPLRFAPPATVELVGSYALHAAARPSIGVDVAVQLPSCCLDQKDYLNSRYFARRVQYLAIVAAALTTSGRSSTAGKWEQSWEYLAGDVRKPVLVLQRKMLDWRLRLLPCISLDTFPAAKLAPDRNTLRSVATEKGGMGGNAEEGRGACLLATPLTNAAILEDMCMLSTNERLRQVVAEVPKLPDTLCLLRAWARAHHLASGVDGLHAHHLSLLVAHLTHKGALSASMSTLHCFRSVLTALTMPGLLPKGVFMSEQAKSKGPLLAAHKTHAEVVLVDSTGLLNTTARMSSAALVQAQSVARRCLSLLDSNLDKELVFRSVFLPRLPAHAAYDITWQLTLPLHSAGVASTDQPSLLRVMERKAEALASKALGSRVRAVRVLPRGPSPQATLSGLAPAAERASLLLTAQVVPELCERLVDVGPPASDGAASKLFRDFWGSRAELRRFQDGKVCEACVWPAPERGSVMSTILQELLQRHIGAECKVAELAADLQHGCLAMDSSEAAFILAARKAEAALAALVKQLRSLSGAALRIISVQGASTTLRQTSPRPPLPHPFAGGGAVSGEVPRCLEQVDCLAQLEGSGKWPDSAEAVQKMKAALACQVAEELQDRYQARCAVRGAALDVHVAGFAFRLHLATEREMVSPPLPASSLGGSSSELGVVRRAAIHHSFIAALSSETPALTATAKVALRWVAAQLLSEQVAEEAVELLVAAALTQQSVLPAPGTRVAGLVAFLRLLATHPWSEQPVAVGTAVSQSEASAEEGVSSAALRVLTPHDPTGSEWTRGSPSAPVLRRMARLAQHHLSLLEGLRGGEVQQGSLLPQVLFTPLLADFDALLWTIPSAVPVSSWWQGPGSGWQGLAAKAGFQPLEAAREWQRPGKRARAVLSHIAKGQVERRTAPQLAEELLVGFNPLHYYVRELSQRFGQAASFFMDAYAAPFIAIKWSPQALKSQGLAVESAHLTQHVVAPTAGPVTSKKRARGPGSSKPAALSVHCQTDDLLLEMMVMGLGLVKGAAVRRTP